MSKSIISCCFLGLMLWFSGCASHSESLNEPKYKDDHIIKEGVGTELSALDLSDLANIMAKNFLNEYVPDSKDKLAIAISEKGRNSGANVDLFSKQFMNILRKSGKYVLSRSIGSEKEEMLSTVRKKREDEEFNEDNKIEKGELKLADLSLSAEITKEEGVIRNDKKLVRYVVFVSIVNLKNGYEIWGDTKIVSKEVSLSVLHEQQENEREYLAESKKYKTSSSSFYSSEASRQESEDEEIKIKDSSKGDYFMMELKLGLGKRNTPVPSWLSDPTELSFMVGGKLGWIYRWSDKYALTFYGEYEATFQGNGKRKNKSSYSDAEEELMTTNSVGLGLRMQMSYFYISGGALYDTNELGSDFFSKTYANVNPYVGLGLIFSGKSFGILVGGRYVASLGNGEYLNRGISGDIGLIFAI